MIRCSICLEPEEAVGALIACGRTRVDVALKLLGRVSYAVVRLGIV